MEGFYSAIWKENARKELAYSTRFIHFHNNDLVYSFMAISTYVHIYQEIGHRGL